MFCTHCGKPGSAGDEFCASCGRRFTRTPEVSPPAAAPYQYVANPTSTAPSPTKSGLGFGITSLILGILFVAFAFADFGLLQSGDYQYILYSEIGFIFFGAAGGIVFGVLGTRVGNLIAKWGLGVSILALILDLALAQYGG